MSLVLLFCHIGGPGIFPFGARCNLVLIEGSFFAMFDSPRTPSINQYQEQLARYQVITDFRLRHGVVADDILCEADVGNYGLITIGASGAAGRLREWLLGNVTRQVVEHASCSVMVVKQG
jgi:nucleotide-binding universal stress UspA family protein